MRHLLCDHSISYPTHNLERTIGLIEPRHVNTSREVAYKFPSPRKIFKSNIYLDSLLLLSDGLWKVKAEYMV